MLLAFSIEQERFYVNISKVGSGGIHLLKEDLEEVCPGRGSSFRRRFRKGNHRIALSQSTVAGIAVQCLSR
jgi:hypothetical protein